MQLRFGKAGVVLLVRGGESQSLSRERVFTEHTVDFFRENM